MQSLENPPDNLLSPPRLLQLNSKTSINKSFDGTPSKRNVREDRRRTIADLREKFKIETLSLSIQGSLTNRARGNEEEKMQENENEISVVKKNSKFEELYKPLDIIGQGSTAVVKKVERIGSGEILVAKMVRTQDPEDLDQLKKEFDILKKVEHKNIIKVEELIVDDRAGHSQIIMEYFPGKTLLEMINKNKGIEENKLKKIIEQVVNALEYLHSRGVVHRDITATNVLVDEKHQVKLIDFSVAKICRDDLWSPKPLKSASSKKKKHPSAIGNFIISDAGTDAYKAPEIIKGIPYGQAVDMWSLGVLTFYALNGHKPFYSKDKDKLNELILSNKLNWSADPSKNVSYEAKIFVTYSLNKLPFLRLTPKEALHHPWIKGITLQREPREYSGTSKRRFSPQPVRKKLINASKVHHDSLSSPVYLIN